MLPGFIQQWQFLAVYWVMCWIRTERCDSLFHDVVGCFMLLQQVGLSVDYLDLCKMIPISLFFVVVFFFFKWECDYAFGKLNKLFKDFNCPSVSCMKWWSSSAGPAGLLFRLSPRLLNSEVIVFSSEPMHNDVRGPCLCFFVYFTPMHILKKNMVPKVAMCSCICFPDPKCATITSFY